MTDVSHIKNHIARGELKKALDLLPNTQEALSLKAQFNDLERKTMLGIISNSEAELTRNKIVSAILQLLDIINRYQLNHECWDIFPQSQQPLNPKGFILYNIPTKMQIRNKHHCFIRVAFDENMLLDGLPQNISYVVKNVRLSRAMEACFISNEYFMVKSLNSIRQRVFRDEITEWHFNVTPLKIGTFPLEFKVTIVLEDGLKEVVLREIIMVITERVPQSMVELKKIASLEFSSNEDTDTVTPLPPKHTPKIDFAAIEKALNNADWVEVISLLDDHFGDEPTPQYSTLRGTIEHHLLQGVMPPLATLQGLRLLINQLKKM